MASTVPLLMRVIANSVTCAARAGIIIKETMKTGNLNIIEKGINDPQTEADRCAQRCIISSLNKNFPNIMVVGEETLDEKTPIKEEWIINEMDEAVLSKRCPTEFADVKDDEIIIFVDPLDGTSDFTQGLLDYVTVLIGIAVNGKAIAGVIHQPFHNYQNEKDEQKIGRTIWGLVGLGAFGYNTTNIASAKSNQDNLIITTTRSHRSDKIDKIIDQLKPSKIIRAGGAGYKALLVLEGVADTYFFPSPGCKRWDTAAAEGVLKSVGGCLTDITGSEYKYEKSIIYNNVTGVLASKDPELHKWMVNNIPDQAKSSLTSQL